MVGKSHAQLQNTFVCNLEKGDNETIMNIKINPKEIKELQDGEVIDKGDLIIFDKTVNVWQTMNREQLGCDVLMKHLDEKPMTLEEFKKRISEANDTWADSASELARDCFNYGKE